MNGSTVVISPPDGNMQDYLDSLRMLKEYENTFRILLKNDEKMIWKWCRNIVKNIVKILCKNIV